MTCARNISRIARRAGSGVSTPIRGTTLSVTTVGHPASTSATAARAALLPATTTGPCHPLATSRRAPSTIPSSSPSSVPPVSSTTSGRVDPASDVYASSPEARLSTATTLPPLDSATRRPASDVTSSSLPTTAIRRPPPAEEHASTSASATAGCESASCARQASTPSRTSPLPSASGRVVRWSVVASSSPVSPSTRAALVKVDPTSTHSSSTAQPAWVRTYTAARSRQSSTATLTR